jgi:PAS domain-containing protein
MRQHYEEVLRVAVNAARIGIWEWDLATGRMTYSPIAREIAGFAADGEITIDMVRSITHPEDYPNTSALAQRALDPELRENAIYRCRLEGRSEASAGQILLPPVPHADGGLSILSGVVACDPERPHCGAGTTL